MRRVISSPNFQFNGIQRIKVTQFASHSVFSFRNQLMFSADLNFFLIEITQALASSCDNFCVDNEFLMCFVIEITERLKVTIFLNFFIEKSFLHISFFNEKTFQEVCELWAFLRMHSLNIFFLSIKFRCRKSQNVCLL